MGSGFSRGYFTEFEPIVNVGENLELLLGSGKSIYKRVTYIEPLPPSSPLLVDFGALNPGASTNKTLISAIQLDDRYFAQFRWFPIDDIQATLFELQGSPRFNIKNSQAVVTRFTRLYDPTLLTTEFFVVGVNRDAYITVKNPTGYRLNNSRLLFFGWKYLVEDLAQEPQFRTIVPTEART